MIDRRSGSHAHITHERIAELFDQGVTYTEIAGRMGCTAGTIYSRLRKARRADPEIARRDLEQRTCECGRTKRPSFSKCYRCRVGKASEDSHKAVQLPLPLRQPRPQVVELTSESNVRCECGRLDLQGRHRIRAANAHACILCQGTSDELDQLMAAERGISVEALRRSLRKYGRLLRATATGVAA